MIQNQPSTEMRSETSCLPALCRIKQKRLGELLMIACVFLLAPLIVIVLSTLCIYRRLVDIALRVQFGGKFVGLLRGTDCIWAVENTVSLSVINVLLILERTRNSSAIFPDDFRNLVRSRILSRNVDTTLEKLFYCRSRRFGYYFWRKNDDVDLNSRIRWLECENANCDGSCDDVSSESFRRNLEYVCNRSLPDDHTASWEILVGRRCPKFNAHLKKSGSTPEDCLRSNALKIPVIFRVHHSLGDGVALLKLLLKTVVEEDETREPVIKTKDASTNEESRKDPRRILSPLRNYELNFQDETEVAASCRKDPLAVFVFTHVTLWRIFKNLRNHIGISLKFSKDVTFDSIKQQIKISLEHVWLNFKNIVLKRMYDKVKEAVWLTTVLLSAPKFWIEQTCKVDENALHGPPQTGNKVISYWLENDAAKDQSPKLLTKIREIRKNTGARFGDIVLAAFSISLHKYYLRINEIAPDALTAILPIRMIMPDENMTLDNNFSVALLRICISNVNGRATTEPDYDSRFFERLRDITRENDELRSRSDYLLNFWVIKYLSAILPADILAATIKSHSTMVFSNLSGPQTVRMLGNSLSNIAFWIPNKSTTALGFSLFSYGNNLHLSLLADKSIVKDESYFTKLLEDTVHEINIVYNNIMLTRLSQSSSLLTGTPKEQGTSVF